MSTNKDENLATNNEEKKKSKEKQNFENKEDSSLTSCDSIEIPICHYPKNTTPSLRSRLQVPRINHPTSDDDWYHKIFPPRLKDFKSKNGKKIWTKLEEAKLLSMVNKHGHNWKSFCGEFPGRTNVDLKDKWRNMLKKNI
ncbi:uncharacterized protein LOC135924984 [Gordionus sp. m RMFG-2023]|uniref:uncharacterized protein LOC135924984 n=1 Tax=Gordionus sp. m RMFG-2023 TaxID=3053472 RepID=UPI0031FC2A89